MTGKQRLTVLGKYLTSGAVDDEAFNMNKWPSCAIGEGSRIPSLAKEGLTLEGNTNNSWDTSIEPNYDGATGFEACAKFFNVPLRIANKLFGGSDYNSLKVGRQILGYLHKH